MPPSLLSCVGVVHYIKTIIVYPCCTRRKWRKNDSALYKNPDGYDGELVWLCGISSYGEKIG